MFFSANATPLLLSKNASSSIFNVQDFDGDDMCLGDRVKMRRRNSSGNKNKM